MNKMRSMSSKSIIWRYLGLRLLILSIPAMALACSNGPAPTPTPTSTTIPTPTVSYSQYQLAYLLLDKYPDIFWCDPDFYPIAREGQEQTNATQQFPTIQANQAEFSAILEHLKLPVKSDYTDSEKLSIYREHKKLTYAVAMTLAGPVYKFSLRTGQNQGLHIEGTIDSGGRINVQKQETSFNTCPICLTRGTLINTLNRQIEVEQLRPGMVVWTMDLAGKRIAAPILKVSSTPVPSSFQVVKVSLSDGRSVTASPGHPTSKMQALGEYRVGDTLDRGQVIDVKQIAYSGGATYDLLPSGGTGFYWANGILLGSTLAH
jgi:hypothetical protein